MVLSLNEQKFLADYDKTLYEKPSVAVDLLVFTIEHDELKVVLVKRDERPFKGEYALPGVFMDISETLGEAAYRGIREETGLQDIYLEQLYTWGEIDRDPRMRVISVSYIALVNIERLRLKVGKRVSETVLYPVQKILEGDISIAFDHEKIIRHGRERIKNKTEYTKVAFELLDEMFTLPELQRVYEILLERPLYKANFRNKVKEYIVETEEMETGKANRPSRYYRLRKEEEEE